MTHEEAALIPPWCRPGTLIVTFGSETVTLDPLDPRDKFDRDAAEVRRLLEKMKCS